MAAIPCLRPLLYLMWKLLGVFFFFLDVTLDILAVRKLYLEQDYVSMGLLIILLALSSVLIQVFSWLWYSYSQEEIGDSTPAYLKKYLRNRCLVAVLHFFQLGVLVRFAGVLEIAARNVIARPPLKGGIAAYLRHDLSLLRLIESFTENAPQLILTVTFMARRGEVDWIIGLKSMFSFTGIAFNVLMYHRSMRSLNKNKNQLTWPSSLVYFLWNLFLLISRVAAVALCFSVLPSWAIGLHFVYLWPVLFFGVWYLKTNFMEDSAKEWLYRGTVALIWYFNWFSASDSRGKRRHVMYHGLIAGDITLLMVLWWYLRDQEGGIFGVPVFGVCAAVAVLFTFGIMGKILYYNCFHPEYSVSGNDEKAPASLVVTERGNPAVTTDEDDYLPQPLQPLTGTQERGKMLYYKSGVFSKAPASSSIIEMDSLTTTDEADCPSQPRPLTGAQLRMQKMAANFYS